MLCKHNQVRSVRPSLEMPVPYMISNSCFSRNGGRDLVLDHFDPGHRAHHFLSILDRADAADGHAPPTSRNLKRVLPPVRGPQGYRTSRRSFMRILVDEYHEWYWDRLILPVSLRNACDMRRRPASPCASRPSSPSIFPLSGCERCNRVDHDGQSTAHPSGTSMVGDSSALFTGVPAVIPRGR